MNNFDSLNCSYFKCGPRSDLLGPASSENMRSKFSRPDSEMPSEGNEQHFRTKQTWDDAARSWGQMVNSQLSLENARRRYGEVVINAVKDKVDAVQNLSSKIGGCCCGAPRKLEKDSLLTYEVTPKNDEAIF